MKKLSRRELLKYLGAGAAGAALAACQPKTVIVERTVEVEKVVTQVIKEVVKETVVVEGKPQIVEKEITKIVEKVVTATPVPAQPPILITHVERMGVPPHQESIDPVMEALSEKLQSDGLNIAIRSMFLDDWDAKYPVLYASGADITTAFDAPWAKMDSLRDQGALLAIEDLMATHGQDLAQLIGDEILDFNVYPDGHTYGIPVYYYYGTTSGVVIRNDLRKAYGAPEPTSEGGMPSVEPFLQAVKTNSPDLIPFVLGPSAPMTSSNLWYRRQGGFAPGLVTADAVTDTEIINQEDMEWFQEAVSLVRHFWEEGLIPKEPIPVDRMHGLFDYFLPGTCACIVSHEPGFKYFEINKQLKTAVPDGEVTGYDTTGQRAGVHRGVGNLKQWNFVVFNAGAPEEKQIAGMQFFNRLAVDLDTYDIWMYGIPGVNYKPEPDRRFSEIEGVDQARNYRRKWFVSGIPGKQERVPTDLSKEAADTLKFFATKDNFDYSPYAQFEIDRKAIETELATLSAAEEEANAAVQTGQLPTEDAIKQYAAILDGSGRQKVKDLVQAQFDDWLAANL